mmetsp:Transcript_37528/g.87551  ORF Transcript_37528/g.87551 Transcript_37528/m.87551 type:complete len:216 (+) Transcript_37528:892-1539(+)
MLLVVDAGIEAEFFGHVAALVGAAGNAHRTGTAGLGELAHGRADRAAGGADHHGLARLGRDDLHEAVPGRDAGHADRAQVGRQRDVGGVDLLQHAALRGVDGDELLPAAHADDPVAHREVRVLRLHHLTDRAADHDFVQRLGGCVALALVHAAAHIGVEAQEVVAHPHLAIGQRGQRRFDEPEVVGLDLALRAGGEDDLAVEGAHGSFQSHNSRH